MNMNGAVEVLLHTFLPQHYKEVSSQLHASVALLRDTHWI
jgi:hypothetical protein